jgi:hypothetical protein
VAGGRRSEGRTIVGVLAGCGYTAAGAAQGTARSHVRIGAGHAGATMNDEPLQRRVDELEARIARLEAALAAGGAPSPASSPNSDARSERAATAPSSSSARQVPTPPPAKPAPPRQSTAPWPAPPPLPEEDAAVAADSAFESSAATSSSSAPTSRSDGNDLERFLGLAVLGRVGIAAVVLAAAYFGQLGWTHLGPAARTAAIYAGGGLFVGLGFALRARVLPRYTALLWGGGVALCWLAGVLGCLRFSVLSPPVAMVAMLLSTALGQWLARTSGQQAMASVALAGAYAAPVLVGTPSPTPTGFFLLLLLLHTWAAFVHERWQWWTCRLLAVVATGLLVIAWYAAAPQPTFGSFAFHLELVWLGLAAPEFVAAARGRSVDLVRAVPIALAAMAVHLALLVHGISSGDGDTYHVVPAALLLAGGAWIRRQDAPFGEWIARAGAVLLPFASLWCVVQWSPPFDLGTAVGEGIALAAAGCLLLVWRPWTGVGELGAALATVLSWLVVEHVDRATDSVWPFLPLFLLVPVALLLVGRLALARIAGLVGAQIAILLVLQPDGDLTSGDPGSAVTLALVGALATLAVWRAARRDDGALLAVAVATHALAFGVWCVWALAALANRTDVGAAAMAMPLWNLRTGAVLSLVALSAVGFRSVPVAVPLPRVVLAGTVLVGLYVGGLLEVLDLAAAWSFGPRAVASSLYSLAFAGVLLGIGFWRGLVPLRWTALCMLVVVVGKVLLHDLSEVDTPLRVLASGVLGGVLLLAAWGYARRQQAGAPPG